MSGTLTERRPSANGTIEGRSGTASAEWREWSRAERLRIGGLVGYAALITLLFIEQLVALFAYAAQSDLHSHIPLIPLITGYLLYSRSSPRAPAYRTSPGGALVAGAIGSAALVAAIRLDGRISPIDDLALTTFAYLSVFIAGLFLFLGSRWVAYAAFPIAFLIFLIPLPDHVAMWLETASVRGLGGRRGVSLPCYWHSDSHRLANYFFSLDQCLQHGRLPRVFGLAESSVVEVMTHPARAHEYDYLMSDVFRRQIAQLSVGTYAGVAQ